MKTMKIIAISDMHGKTFPKIKKCDIVCCAGDIVPLDLQNDIDASTEWFIKTFIPWVDTLKCNKFFLVAGNHDYFLERIITENVNNISTKLVYLKDTEYVYEGVKIYGTPWIPSLSNWAFYGDSDYLNERFSLIPNDTDILITHTPPRYKNYGVVTQKCFNIGRNWGCYELYNNIKNKNIKLLLCGHIHSGDHKIGELNDKGGRIVNVSILDENYEIKYKPTCIEL